MYNFRQDRVQQLIQCGDWDGCWNYLAETIDQVKDRQSAFELKVNPEADFKDPERYRLVKSYSAVISKVTLSLLTNEQSVLDEKCFYTMLCYHEVLHNLFAMSHIENTDRQVQNFVQNKKRLSDEQQRKLVLLLSLNTNIDLIPIIKRLKPPYKAASIVTFLGYESIYRPRQHDNKTQLLSLSKDVESIDITSPLIGHLTMPYFLVSYLDYEDKHKIKLNLNRIIQKFLRHHGKQIKKSKQAGLNQGDSYQRTDKPRLLVYGENMHSGNAMTRSFSKRVKQLQDHFDLHFLVAQDRIDDEIKQSYDNVHAISFEGIEKMFELVFALSPDIIYFPSIGLNIGSLVLSNYRCSPIQIMGLGFAATSMNPYIDYVLGMEDYYHPDAFPKDKYIADGAPIMQTAIKPVQSMTFENKLANEPPKKTLKVAIVGPIAKMSAPFIHMLKDIEEQAEFDISFSVMTSARGINVPVFQEFLQKTLGSVELFGNQAFENYFKELKSCDILLSNFPHGHSNTLMDALLAGKPCLSLFGNEPHMRTEFVILKHIGLGDKFIAYSKQEYKDKFFDFAKEIMAGKRDFCSPKNVYDTLYSTNTNYHYGEVMKWIYEHHDKMKSSKEKLFHLNSPQTKSRSAA